MKVWDLGGQYQFRNEWGRYTRGCDVILFVVDVFDRARIPEAKKELHVLLESPEVNAKNNSIPIPIPITFSSLYFRWSTRRSW
jgi:GTPase SAR1 family protein